MADGSRLRLGFIGTGWITARHLAVLARLRRTELVGVVSRDLARAAAVATMWGGTGYDELTRMLDERSPDVAFVCLPPDRSPAACAELVRRGIPFLTEKPLGAVAADPERIGASLADAASSRLWATSGAASTSCPSCAPAWMPIRPIS